MWQNEHLLFLVFTDKTKRNITSKIRQIRNKTQRFEIQPKRTRACARECQVSRYAGEKQHKTTPRSATCYTSRKYKPTANQVPFRRETSSSTHRLCWVEYIAQVKPGLVLLAPARKFLGVPVRHDADLAQRVTVPSVCVTPSSSCSCPPLSLLMHPSRSSEYESRNNGGHPKQCVQEDDRTEALLCNMCHPERKMRTSKQPRSTKYTFTALNQE